MGADLCIRQAVAGEAGDLRFLCGEVVTSLDLPFMHGCACGHQLSPGAFGEALHAHRSEKSDRYAVLARTTGIIGITFMVLLFGPIIALASADEPPLEATAAEAVKYFGNLEATWG